MAHRRSEPTFLRDRIILYISHPAGAEGRLHDIVASGPFADLVGHDIFGPPGDLDITTFPPNEADRSLSVYARKIRGVSVPEMIKMIFVRRDDFGPRGGMDSDKKFHLAGASPSWLMPAAYHGIGHGGPGSKPEEAKPNDGDWNFNFDRNEAELAAAGGEDAHVLILDTFRSKAELEAARAKYEAPDGTPQPLLNSLLEPDRIKEYIPAWPGDLAELGSLGAGPERYRMSDHGIFAAGIIHSIAPNAVLHLYEVLNEYGVGSLESIARGLLHAQTMRQDNPDWRIFVNCSLMLSAPAKGHGEGEYPNEFKDVAVFDYMNQSFGDIVAQLTTGNNPVTIVAAAGNDRKSGVRPPVRYPAAFPNVISVGAVTDDTPADDTKTWTTASYSNQSNRPTKGAWAAKDGYLTLGGERADKGGKGVLGIYTENGFPGDLRANADKMPENVDAHEYGTANDRGWALWAGTSFATPIITGLLARTPATLRTAGGPSTDSVAKLNEFATKTGGQQPANEHVIFVRQGSPGVIA